jgi:putative PEP-CTERM system TPR-repeat lipoprotein
VRQYGDAAQAYQTILEARPWSSFAGIDMARAEIAAQRSKEAIVLLDRLLSQDPERPEIIYLRGLAAFEEHDFRRAVQQIATLFGRTREFYAALMIGGAAGYATGRYDSAKNYVTAYLDLFPNDVLAQQLLAAVEAALAETQSGAPAKPLTPELLAAIGLAAIREGDPTTANRFVKEKAEEQITARVAAPRAAARDPIAELEQTVKSEPGSAGGWASLYFAYMHAKSFDKALAAAAELDRLKPNDPIVADLAGVAYLAQGDIKAGRAALQRAIALRANDYDANSNLAQLAIAEATPDEARRLYRGLLKDNPQSIRAAIALADLEDASGHGDVAESLLQQAVKTNPGDVVAHAALAKFQLAKGKFQAVLDQAQPELTKYPHSPILLEAVGRAYLATGQAGAALGTFKKLVAEQSWDGSAHLYLADAYAAEGLWDEVVSEATQALKLSPGDNGARFALARGLFADGRLTEARSLVEALKAGEPGNPAVDELDGLMARGQGRKQDAIDAFKAVLAVDDNAIDRLLLAQAQAAAGKVDDAAATLAAWLGAHPGDLAIRRQLGDLYLAVGRFDAAIEQYDLVVKSDAKNAPALNNLAWALAQAGRPKAALPYARSAAALDSGSADTLDTLGTLLAQDGNKAEAVTILNRAAQLASGPGGVQLHLAQVLANMGQNEQAVDLLHAMLDGDQRFKEREAAEKLLHQLGG